MHTKNALLSSAYNYTLLRRCIFEIAPKPYIYIFDRFDLKINVEWGRSKVDIKKLRLYHKYLQLK